MLRVWFGNKEGSIYNTSMFFDNRYERKWITEDFSKRLIKDIDQSDVIDADTIKSPVLGLISPEEISGGVKTVILMNHYSRIYFNGSNCGNNCARWILDIGKRKDCSMVLYHTMVFDADSFDIRIMNHKNLIVHNMSEFMDASIQYLRGKSV